jgi:DNA-directed RNA polymerase specialized sigma24 family protein
MEIRIENVVNDWDKKIATTLLSKGIRYSEMQDLKSALYLSMIERGFCNRYKKAKGAFSTYLYVFVHNFIKNYYAFTNTKKRSGFTISMQELLSSTLGFSSFLRDNRGYYDLENTLLVGSILKDIKGKKYERIFSRLDVKTSERVLKFILEGYTKIEIARKLEISQHELMKIISKLAVVDSVQELKEMC